MDAQLKEKWIAALESGEYPKTIGHLKDPHGYCCLGVLLAINNYEFATYQTKGATSEPYYEPTNSEIHSGNDLSIPALETFGLSTKVHDDLISLNDDSDTFAPIVEYLRTEEV